MAEGRVYPQLISNIEDAADRQLARASYKKKLSLLIQFGERVKELTDEFHIEDITDPQDPQDFLEFFKRVMHLGETVRGNSYIDADNNYLKIMDAVANLSDEDYWEARRELYQDEYLSLGVFIFREEKSFRSYLEGRAGFFDWEYMDEQFVNNVFKDREHMILGAWKAGGVVVQNYLRVKANQEMREGEWQFPLTRRLLLSHGLIQGE